MDSSSAARMAKIIGAFAILGLLVVIFGVVALMLTATGVC